MEIYEQSYLVHTYEVDPSGHLRPVALLNYLQDAAGVHAEHLGVSVPSLHQLGLKWLLTRYRAVFHRHARLGERLAVRTWPSSRDGMQIPREFQVRDENGGLVAAAVSGWMVLDLRTQRSVRPSERLPAFPVQFGAALEGGFSPLRRVSRADLDLSFRVRWADLDLNRHVNNAAYIAWALETVPDEVLEHWEPDEIEVVYRAEAFHPGRVSSRTESHGFPDSSRFFHQMISEPDGRELARLSTTWRLKPGLEG